MPEYKTRGSPTRLAPWIRRAREANRDGDSDAKLELLHETTSLVIASWLGAELADEGAVTKAVIEQAQNDCDGRDCLSPYVLRFIIDDDTRATTFLRLQPASMTKPPVVAEGADVNGLVGQLMRHNEGLVRLVVTNTDRQLQGMARLLDTVTARLEASEHERRKLEAELRERKRADRDDDDGDDDDLVGLVKAVIAEKMLGTGNPKVEVVEGDE